MATKMYEVVSVVDGEPTFAVPLSLIWPEFQIGGALVVWSPEDFITDRQRRWWKGVLLPALVNDTGDSKAWWETQLKTQVMPDRFKPEIYTIDGEKFGVVPSITTLGKRAMAELIDGSIQYLHEHGFGWVTPPDITLRSK